MSELPPFASAVQGGLEPEEDVSRQSCSVFRWPGVKAAPSGLQGAAHHRPTSSLTSARLRQPTSTTLTFHFCLHPADIQQDGGVGAAAGRLQQRGRSKGQATGKRKQTSGRREISSSSWLMIAGAAAVQTRRRARNAEAEGSGSGIHIQPPAQGRWSLSCSDVWI